MRDEKNMQVAEPVSAGDARRAPLPSPDANLRASLPNLNVIVAVCDDWGIGIGGGMLVDNRADMRHFVRHTKGHTVLMGRKTLESFPGGQPLKGRRNVVITRDPGFARGGVDVAHSVDEALAMVADDPEVWLIGGEMIYRELLPLCTRAEITKNHCVRPADTFFPNLDEDPAWHVASSTARDDEGNPLVTPEGIPFEFVTYTRA